MKNKSIIFVIIAAIFIVAVSINSCENKRFKKEKSILISNYEVINRKYKILSEHIYNVPFIIDDTITIRYMINFNDEYDSIKKYIAISENIIRKEQNITDRDDNNSDTIIGFLHNEINRLNEKNEQLLFDIFSYYK